MRFGRKYEVQIIPSVSRPTNTGVKDQDSKLGIVAYTSGQDFGGLNLSPEEYDSTIARRAASDSKNFLKHEESTPKLVDVPFYGIPIPEIIAFVAGIILVVANPAEDAENNTLGTVLVIGAMLGFILCSPLSFTRVTNFIPDLVYLAIGSAWTLYGLYVMDGPNIGGGALVVATSGVPLSSASHLIRRLLALRKVRS